MTFPLPPPHSASLRFVAQASRPGSIESRHVHRCTCSEDPDRSRVWNPEHVETWQASLSLDCPAHGRLLEHYLASVNAGLFGDVSRLGQPRAPLRQSHQPSHPRRSFGARLSAALRGFMAGWRNA